MNYVVELSLVFLDLSINSIAKILSERNDSIMGGLEYKATTTHIITQSKSRGRNCTNLNHKHFLSSAIQFQTPLKDTTLSRKIKIKSRKSKMAVLN